MINSKLDSIFNDGIYPPEEIVPKDPEYRNIHKQINDEEQYFIKKMSADDFKRIEKLEDLFLQSSSIYACESFMYGFRLGALIILEIFSDEKEKM